MIRIITVDREFGSGGGAIADAVIVGEARVADRAADDSISRTGVRREGARLIALRLTPTPRATGGARVTVRIPARKSLRLLARQTGIMRRLANRTRFSPSRCCRDCALSGRSETILDAAARSGSTDMTRGLDFPLVLFLTLLLGSSTASAEQTAGRAQSPFLGSVPTGQATGDDAAALAQGCLRSCPDLQPWAHRERPERPRRARRAPTKSERICCPTSRRV